MSAEILREAAALMRERAQNVALTDWHCVDTTQERFSGYDVWTHDAETHWTVATSDYADTAEHIASWHPAVALAVADWLEHEADHFDMDDTTRSRALAVARAYLGRDA